MSNFELSTTYSRLVDMGRTDGASITWPSQRRMAT